MTTAQIPPVIRGYDAIGGPPRVSKVRLLYAAHPDPPAIFPYAGGDYAWTQEDLALFPRARYRFISELADPAIADIIACEPRAATPMQAAGAALERKHLFPGDTPGIYCSRDDVGPVMAACDQVGLGDEWKLLLATLDGSIYRSYLGKPVAACQFTGGPGASFDVWDVFDVAWLRDGPAILG